MRSRHGATWGRMLAGAWLTAVASACAPSSTPPVPAEPAAAGAALPGRDGLTVLEHRARPAPARSVARRNIFRERDREAPAPASAARSSVPADLAPASPQVPPAPPVTVLGFAESTVGGRLVRTAVISAAGELWMVKEGETVAGRFRVGAVAPDRVDLTDVQTGMSRSYRLY